MLGGPSSEEFLLNIQSKSPLVQLEAISFCSIFCYLKEETDSHLDTTFFQVVVESDKVSPQLSFLQSKQLQLGSLFCSFPTSITLSFCAGLIRGTLNFHHGS